MGTALPRPMHIHVAYMPRIGICVNVYTRIRTYLQRQCQTCGAGPQPRWSTPLFYCIPVLRPVNHVLQLFHTPHFLYRCWLFLVSDCDPGHQGAH